MCEVSPAIPVVSRGEGPFLASETLDIRIFREPNKDVKKQPVQGNQGCKITKQNVRKTAEGKSRQNQIHIRSATDWCILQRKSPNSFLLFISTPIPYPSLISLYPSRQIVPAPAKIKKHTKTR